MNREYNDNKMYNSALDELRFSDEAKSRMVNRLMAPPSSRSSRLPFIVYAVFRASRRSAWLPLWC